MARGYGVKLAAAVVAIAACAAQPEAEPSETLEQAAGAGETHPYQARLVCTRAPGSTLVGVLWELRANGRAKIAEFSSAGNVGACELAARASRGGRVCVPSGYGAFAVRDLAAGTTAGSYAALSACTSVTLGAPSLRTEPGYVDLLAPAELAPLRSAIPQVADVAVEAAIRGPRTIWYDEASLVFAYQDSFGSPKGLRANRVGYDVGSTSNVPDIRALTEYFEPQHFKFPFSLTAGATFESNVYALYFWLPPVDSAGAVVPVRMWKNRSHWQWVFPEGTILGEVLFIRAPDDGRFRAFEVRARRRQVAAWSTSVFRPFASAAELASAVKARRPAYQSAPDLATLVAHLESPSALTPHTLSSAPYAKIFPPMSGAMDYLPPIADPALVKELLEDVTLRDVMGTRWKEEGGGRVAHAASTHAPFHIVPAEYPAGMFELSERGCRTCHDQTSRPLNNLDPRVVLYGEVWGEDEIFTWHPFAIDTSSFSVADGNRAVNPRFVAAGLVAWGAPVAALPKPYAPVYE